MRLHGIVFPPSTYSFFYSVHLHPFTHRVKVIACFVTLGSTLSQRFSSLSISTSNPRMLLHFQWETKSSLFRRCSNSRNKTAFSTPLSYIPISTGRHNNTYKGNVYLTVQDPWLKKPKPSTVGNKHLFKLDSNLPFVLEGNTVSYLPRL